ncbi:ribosomal protection-like ABC-F family protein [Bacillus sp. FJAT-49736]|uniref:ribosomal protection-like ABC-F family protein n=1 Tax=Bacillus sp. FJAT-49736 TaxID=2833582 RepID=UPI001BC982DF|nr:ABC-F type ribosomal protection protein [Bacillus sp. FJAT-49736]MBS4174418.1 ABC-F type ribosomal protection protein [Bacillus sp. FJAT-49736]
MRILKTENLGVEINAASIFHGVNLEIQKGEHVALIGDNGVGKTTLLKVLSGKTAHSSGKLDFAIGRDEIGWMMDEQVDESLPTMEYICMGNEACYHLKNKLEKMQEIWNQHSEDNAFIEEYNAALQQYMDCDGYEWEARLERISKELGIEQGWWNIPFSDLSGGQKTRVRLARLLVKEPQMLVLDEPTNHMDIESVEWLVGWLQQYKGTVLFTSHERDFIDRVATATFALTDTGAKRYHGGYSTYKEMVEQERNAAEALYKKYNQERKKLLDVIQTYKQWYQKASNSASERNPFAKKQAGRHAKQVKVKEKALERLESKKIERPKDNKGIEAFFDAEAFEAKHMIQMKNVSFSHQQDVPFFHHLHLQINRGDRMAVIGRNGSGKTTLLKLLTGHLLPTDGEVKLNPQLKVGYLMQELDQLNMENSILDELLVLEHLTQEEARTILACFLFRREDVFKKIKDLSMGEKCRVAFVKLYFSDANLLVLDEPTNYLDISTREQIEEALSVYPGSVVMVSHDPYLLRKVANRVVEIQSGHVSEYKGSYKDWEESKRLTPERQKLENEISLLEMELVELYSQEEENLEEIREIKAKLQVLKKSFGK